MKVAIPRFGESVAPCFEYCATMAIFTIEDGQIVDQVDFPIRSREPFDRVRLLRDQGVEVVICGGVHEAIENALRAHKLRVISWVSGDVEDLLQQFLAGSLIAGPARTKD